MIHHGFAIEQSRVQRNEEQENGQPFQQATECSQSAASYSREWKRTLQRPLWRCRSWFDLRVGSVFTKWVKGLGMGSCLGALNMLVFFSRVAESAVASQLSSPAFLMSVLFPHRVPFTASRLWSMAPSSWEEPRQGRAARSTWAYLCLIL